MTFKPLWATAVLAVALMVPASVTFARSSNPQQANGTGGGAAGDGGSGSITSDQPRADRAGSYDYYQQDTNSGMAPLTTTRERARARTSGSAFDLDAE